MRKCTSILNNSYRFESPEVIYCKEKIVEVSNDWIKLLTKHASLSPRKTCRLCLHSSKNSTLHQMVILHNKITHVPIHKHLHSEEIINVFSGSAVIKFYDNNGVVSKTIKLSQDNCLTVKIPKNVFHSLIVKSDWFLFQEIIKGPFKPKNTKLASWEKGNSI